MSVEFMVRKEWRGTGVAKKGMTCMLDQPTGAEVKGSAPEYDALLGTKFKSLLIFGASAPITSPVTGSTGVFHPS